MKIRFWKQKLFTGLLFLGCLAVYYILQLPCPFQHFLHIPCFGCGMTRAYLCLLQLDIAGAFSMHAMFWSVPLLVVYYLYDWKLFKKSKWLDYVILGAVMAGFLANWLLHLL